LAFVVTGAVVTDVVVTDVVATGAVVTDAVVVVVPRGGSSPQSEGMRIATAMHRIKSGRIRKRFLPLSSAVSP
jgi:hypothetical protein